ncbi:MAG: thioredoxin domain-containing protein [Gammaproteobacteria bacterium]|nr:thioredoxin domain-containing protein [Gammaproteobacteria bacterium]
MTKNRLSDETSPYLLQHADNPVHWQPWDRIALTAARETDTPILLSIGYSACHWCHVMAHESFEDEDTAHVMNAHFINVKVDREERPDLDQIYQLAHQMLTQRGGGWPLTMFLTPDTHIPFFGGTYFPPRALHGLPAFRDLLSRVAEFYAHNKAQIEEQNRTILQVFRDSAPQFQGDTRLDDSPLKSAREELINAFDQQHGGFGGAPKFPQTPGIERILRTWRRSAFAPEPDLQSLYVATKTLTEMARGGLYDQLGGGFYRYTVDGNWRIPHFEKMLYDNAQLLPLYAQTWRISGEALFGRVANQTADWMLREMLDAGGGFYTALDADSEGHEGRFYVWDKTDIKEALNDTEYAVIRRRFGLDQPPNFEGQWHLYVAATVDEVAAATDHSVTAVRQLLDAAQIKLFSVRTQRVRPFCDTKRLTSSNALAIRALAIAGNHLERPDLIDTAAATLEFIREKLLQEQGLLTSYADGRASLNAYLNDYAYLLDAILELLQARWSTDDLHLACRLADTLLTEFEDPDHGGFFFTSVNHEALMHRMKPLSDDASPAGNGVAVRALNRLGHLTGDSRYLRAAERTLQLAWPAICQYPRGHCALLDALEDYLLPVQSVIIRAPEAQLAHWLTAAAATYSPGRMSFAIAADQGGLPDMLSSKTAEGDGVAYLCEGLHCNPPVTRLSALPGALKKLG